MGQRNHTPALFVSAFLSFMAVLAPACADEAPSAADAKERATLESFGTANPACVEWSDGCAVCARKEDNTFQCSLPGIACQPTGLVCRKPTPEVPSLPEAPKPAEPAKP